MSGRVTNFLGGSPLSVILRLLVISLLVGVLLSWLDLRPIDLLHQTINVVQTTWRVLFGSLGQVLNYLLVGAVIVVPIFLLSRLFKAGRG